MINPGPFVLGGNVFGWTVQREEGFRILDAFVDGGGTLIDTADVYAAWGPGNRGGESETLIGEWLAQGPRDRVQVATKVAKWSEQPGLSPTNIRAAIDGSLRRLRTDHVDLYYAHEDDNAVAQSAYLTAFNDVVTAGKVKTLGASNFRASRLTTALLFQRDNGLQPFEVSQDKWNLVERGIEGDLVPVLHKEGLIELPFYALASGFLTGKYRPGIAVDSVRAGGVVDYVNDPRNVKLLSVLDEVAAAHHTSVTAVSLAWLRAQPTVGAPITSARTVEQLKDLFDGASLVLAVDELAALSAASAR